MYISAFRSQNDCVGELLEDYFTAQSRKGKTSNNTLQCKLSTASILPTDLPRHVEVMSRYTDYHNYWLRLLHLGFNILLYGVGSKISVLNQFCEQALTDSCHMIVNGFVSSTSIKKVLTLISSEVLNHQGKFRKDLDHANFIKETLQAQPKEIFLIIHSLDGAYLRVSSAQVCLSSLAQSPSIHILASIDHINAPLMWDQKMLSQYNWLWFDTSTYEPYTWEGAYEKSLLVQPSGLDSLSHIMQSVTSNAKGIFRLLARYQLDKKSCPEVYLGMAFDDYYRKCRENFLVNSEVTLRSLLVEFHDHKLVKSHRCDGIEYMIITVEDSILTQFMDQLGNEE